MAGGGWQSVHDPLALPQIMERWESAFAAGEAFEMTMSLKGADGVFRTFLTQIEPARDVDGNVVRWIGMHTDITAQVDAESKLKAANSQMQALSSYRHAVLGQLAEGIIITDAGGRIVFVNEAANTLHGVAKLNVEPDEYSDTYSLFTESGKPHPTETLPLTRAALNEETVIGARWLIRRPDGTEVLAIGNAQPVYADNGTKIGAVLTIQDDTQRYGIEKALAEALTAKEALLYEVNHRVKNSLQIVTALLMLQSDSASSPELKQSLKEACSRVDIVANLHRRLYSGGQHTSVDLARYIQEFAAETVDAFAAPGTVDLQFGDMARVDLEMDHAVPLALIIGELLTNAIKYAFDGKGQNEITVAISTNENQVRILVSDNGKGLPPGFDVAATSGFGMMIVGALLQQLSGKLEQAEQSRGTGFVVSFPKPA